ncbi:protein PLASTID MOVEMENT IMPAIRED 1-RELATED 1-like isoform X2 [Rutidosis leptorrhynchoides]|uniref:protein PLASTID MOVEMENT IMPAIRED 1-RELATED 1-like isoform X2 n=1 Tax=Rutidosis leptorrhynchoides TaxID=125765 RepID=UPI003A99919F
MESAKINIDDYGSSRLLHDIEEIGKALYLRDNPPKTSIYPNYVKDDLLLNNKKSSIWKWKPLKAFTHIRNHRLNCSFFLQIHSISGLPLSFNDLSLCVHWKRKNDVLKSRFVCVKEGVAEFEETLIHRCSVYVSKSGAHDDVEKYAPKLSLLYVSIVGAPNLDIGKHWIDLTKLLPLSLTELEDEKNRYGKWITSFKLTGKAKGAVINVSFGFSLSVDSFMRPNNFGKVPDKGNGKMLERVGSIPGNSSRRARMSNLSFDTKARNGNVVNEGPSVNILYELLDDDANSSYSKESSSISNEVYDDEFMVVDKGVELSKSVESLCIETINVAELFDDEVCGDFETETDFDGIRSNDNNVCIEESSEELDLFLHNLSISESRELDFSCQENQFFEDDMKNGEICEGGNLVKSRSLDDLTNIVVDEFMNLFGSDSEPESPRERLLRQFEEETLDLGNLIFDLRAIEDRKDCSNIFDSTFLFREVETEPEYESGPSLISRRKAKMLENLETNELMQKWGLNETAFVNSPRTDSGAFGSPVYLSPERPHELPSLGIGLGSFLKTKDGGFLRSINPLIFKKAKNGEKLILHVSNSVVIPLEMGCNGMDILMKWATVGSEKMLFQATRLMALEEITGKTLQQEAWESKSKMEALERGQWLLHKSEVEETQTKICCEIDSEYVSIDNIIPLAIEKIQYLLIEGLRIQSRMSTEDPPSTINVASTSNNRVDELFDMSISLNELIKSDSTNLGILNNFTLGLQMLLRDPLRDYEPVGIPMLALVQVEKSTSVELTFKVNEVHVTGFKADPQKKQHSGSRWLHSSGMTGKQKRYPLTKSTALMRSSILSKNKMKHEDTLWSLSSYVHGEVPKWKELSGLSLYVRNPDIIFN